MIPSPANNHQLRERCYNECSVYRTTETGDSGNLSSSSSSSSALTLSSIVSCSRWDSSRISRSEMESRRSCKLDRRCHALQYNTTHTMAESEARNYIQTWSTHLRQSSTKSQHIATLKRVTDNFMDKLQILTLWQDLQYLTWKCTKSTYKEIINI